MALKIMILGANGFIGSALTNAILRNTPWEVFGIDLADNKLGDLPKNTGRFHFVEGDITINKEWVEYHVKKCDVVVPLVAIANPAQYGGHLVHDEVDGAVKPDQPQQPGRDVFNGGLGFVANRLVQRLVPDLVADLMSWCAFEVRFEDHRLGGELGHGR